MLDNDNPNEQYDQTGGGLGAAPATSGPDSPATGAAGEGGEGQEAAPAKKTARKGPAKKTTAKKSATKKTAAKKTASGRTAAKAAESAEGGTAPDGAGAPDREPTGESPAESPAENPADNAPAKKTAAKRTARKTAAKKTTAKKTSAKKAASGRTATKAAASAEEAGSAQQAATAATAEETPDEAALAAGEATVEPPAAAAQLAAAEAPEAPEATAVTGDAADTGDTGDTGGTGDTGDTADTEDTEESAEGGAPPATAVLFKAPEKTPTRRRRRTAAAAEAAEGDEAAAAEERSAGRRRSEAPTPGEDREAAQGAAPAEPEKAEAGEKGEENDEEQGSGGGGRRRRRRGGRRRRKGDSGDSAQNGGSEEAEEAKSGKQGPESKGPESKGKQGDESVSDNDEGSSGGSRRRRRRRRSGEEGDGASNDPENTVTRVRKPRNPEDEITALQGSTRLEAKKQRRREGREAGRRRAPIVSEAEFLARREAVDRVMVIRQKKDLTQIAVLEDKVLVEHYVARESQTSLIGNVYLGRVQNVLPSMEAAFIDIGKGRNAVLYAGEVNWDSLGAGNGPRKIEQVLKSGQPVLVQVTKDPIGHKGARLTSQISLPGRFLVYVPDGNTSGISRKLPDTERNRLKTLLKEIVPDSAGVIVRTAAEGASEEELTRDVERLTARWEDIAAKVEKGNAPQLLYGEPDLTLKVVRDLFTEDFGKLVVSGDEAWDMVEGYVQHVAPDLAERLERYDEADVFAAYRIDEQIAKALDRKVWLPSGGSLIIDRTEAMTVVDVNTGKFTGSGGNLEETVTKNNLEAAEEIVRQLRLRDIGGIIVIDFIDMVLESNRDLVLRRLVECLGRDRTRHQVAEVTSLGLVQMTRKRIGTGLLEAFSEACEHCGGRGLVTHQEPVEQHKKQEEEPRRSRRGRGRGKGEDEEPAKSTTPSPKELAAMARHEPAPAAAPDAEREPVAAPTPAAEPTPETEPGPAEDHGPAKRHGVPETVAPTPRAEPAETEPAQAAAEPAAEPAEEPAAEQPPAPAAPPRVVTTSRRRVARRPAGPPSTAAVAGNGAGAESEADQGGGAPGDTQGDNGQGDNGQGDNGRNGTAQAEAAPSGAGVTAAEDSSHDGAGGEGEPEPAAAAHVPVKKKGSRKR